VKLALTPASEVAPTHTARGAQSAEIRAAEDVNPQLLALSRGFKASPQTLFLQLNPKPPYFS